jgi:RNA polymerase sigma factor (sigma-70 family)
LEKHLAVNLSKPAELITRERPGLLRYLRRRISDLDEMDFEDIVSDITVNLFQRADLTLPIGELTAYLYRAVYNKAIDLLRRRKHSVPLDAPAEPLSHPGADPAAEAERSEFQARLFEALAELGQEQRAVWIATELEGYSFRELAERWNEPIGTLLARKHRATERIRLSLADLKTAESE